MEGSRGVLQESARLARGKVTRLEDFEPARCDALAIPGGYGVAKNLMTGFAETGARPGIDPQVEALLKFFLAKRRPIGVVSLAKLLLEHVAEDVFTERLRAESADQVYVDAGRRLLYTPGYLAGERLDQIEPGIEALGERMLAMCREESE